MSRLKKIGWSMVPGWVTYMCSIPCDPPLTAEHAALAGCLISYSFWKKGPITPNYQSAARAMYGDRQSFNGELVGYIDRLIEDLLQHSILHRTPDGKLMPGLAARHYERDSATDGFWEPLRVAVEIERVIGSISKQGSR